MGSSEKERSCEILGIDQSTPEVDIQRAYRHLALQYHPDRCNNANDFAKFQLITTAYKQLSPDLESLSDPEQIFFTVFKDVLLYEDDGDYGLYAFFSSSQILGASKSSADEMYIEDDEDSDTGEKDFEKFAEIVKNCRLKGKPVPEGFTDERIEELREILIKEKEAYKNDGAQNPSLTKIKQPNQVPLVKQKPKSKKQKEKEAWRREKEMENIAYAIQERNKQEEERAEKKKIAELEKQRRLEEERARQLAEDKKRREQEERERQERERREREEEEVRKKAEEEKRKKEDKKKAAEAAKQKQIVDQKAKEEEEKKKATAAKQKNQAQQQQQASTQQQLQQQQQRQYQLPPRFAQKQQQKNKMQTVPPGGQNCDTESQEIGTWQNPEGDSANPILTWGNQASASSSGSSDIIVDSRDKEQWPSIGDQSESASEAGDDNASVHSGSVISSSSNPGPDGGQGQGSSAIQGQSASSDWGANSSDNKLDSTTSWGTSSLSPGGANNSNSSSVSWGESIPSQAVNQGHNMQANNNNPNSPIEWGSSQQNSMPAQGTEHGPTNQGAQSSNGSRNSPATTANSWGGISSSSRPSSVQSLGDVATNSKADMKQGASQWGMMVPQESSASNNQGDSNGKVGEIKRGNDMRGTSQWGMTTQGSSSSSSSSSGSQWGNVSKDEKSSMRGGSGWGSPSPTPSPSTNTGDWGKSASSVQQPNSLQSMWGDPTNSESSQWGGGSHWGPAPGSSQRSDSGSSGNSSGNQRSAKRIGSWGSGGGTVGQTGSWTNSNSSGRDWGESQSGQQSQWGNNGASQWGSSSVGQSQTAGSGWGDATGTSQQQNNPGEGWGSGTATQNNGSDQWGRQPTTNQKDPSQLNPNNPQGQWGNVPSPTNWGSASTQDNSQSQWGNMPVQNNVATNQWGNGAPQHGNSSQGASWAGTSPGPTSPAAWGSGSSYAKVLSHNLPQPPPSQQKPAKSAFEEEISRQVDSHEGWGMRPVSQDTNWDAKTSPEPKRKARPEDDSVWRQEVNNGTAIWESVKNTSGKPAFEEKPVVRNDNSITWSGPPAQQAPPPRNDTSSWGGDATTDGMSWGGAGPAKERSWPSGANNPPAAANTAATPSNWNKPPPTNNASWGGQEPRPLPTQWAGATNNSAPQDGWGGSGSAPRSSQSSARGSTSSSGWGDDVKPATAGKSTGGTGWGAPSPPTNRKSTTDVDDGTAFWGDPTQPTQSKPQNWSTPSTPNTPITPSTNPVFPGQRPKSGDMGGAMWGQGPPPPNMPTSGGWGDAANPIANKSEEVSSMWPGPSQSSSGWGDSSASQWPVGGAKPKTPSTSGWESDSMQWNAPGPRKTSESSWNDENWAETEVGEWDSAQENSTWNSAQGWTNRNGAKKITGMPFYNKNSAIGAKLSSLNMNPQQPQMRSRLLQQLTEMGFKKEDAQNALISNNMNLESAIAELFAGANMDKRDDNDLDRKNRNIQRQFSAIHQQDKADFDNSDPFSQNTPNLSNAQQLLGKQGSVSSSPNPSINPVALQQRLLMQQQQQQQQQQQNMPPSQGQVLRGQVPNMAAAAASAGVSASTQQQLLQQQQIVQQLQMAVRAGLINPQLLNQQLTPQMLVLLQQLLQLQTILQRLVQQQQLLQANKTGMNPLQQRSQMEQNAVVIQTIKQKILQQQQQIAQAQQAMAASSAAKDALSSLHPKMTSLSINEDSLLQTPAGAPQSRLTQWKLPSPDKEVNEYLDKAPGSKPSNIHQSHSTPNLQDKLDFSSSLSGDSMWSTSVSSSTAGSSWPTSSAITSSAQLLVKDNSPAQSDNKESQSSNSNSQSTTPVFDISNMIEEFVPGKKWQGTVTKSVEEDPHITPGSVASVANMLTIKPEVLNALSSSPTANTDQQVSSWSGMKDFPRSISTIASNSGGSKSTWSSGNTSTVASGSLTPTSISSELWGVPVPGKNASNAASRPPPGLTNQKAGGGGGSTAMWGSGGGSSGGTNPGFSRANSWAGGSAGSAFTPVGASWDRMGSNVSTWVVLRNLTPQIDGSTLKTLCMQHGPVQMFYLSLHNGTAVVRYHTREEAMKAQKSLNHCILGNTTIIADFASDAEMQRFKEQNTQTSNSWSQGTSTPTFHRSASTFAGKNDVNQWNGSSLGLQSSMWGGSGLWGGSSTLEERHTPFMPDMNILSGDQI